MLKKNKQKKPKPSLLPTKNTTQENCKQNINDAQIWPRVVLPDFKGMTWTLFWRSKLFTYNLPKDNSGPKRWYNGRKESTKERERHRLREREKQDGRGKAEDGVCKRRHGPTCVRLLFKMEEALLFLTENHMKRENEEWACCKITKRFSKL